MRLTAFLVLFAALLVFAPPARGAAWRRPVGGPVARAFAYGPGPFRRGWHRGVDLAAAPGTTVRAACAGTVVTARRVALAGGVITLRCGPWRVTHLPVTAIAVRRGAALPAGARLGLLGASPDHAGLHLGVRRSGDRFGYVDPMRFLGGERRLPPPLVTVAPLRSRLGPAPPAASAPAAAPAAAATAWQRPATAPARVAARTGPDGAAPRVRALAPWPAWAGLALVLSGAIGGGVRLRWRRRARAAAGGVVAKGVA